jgi:hypothetical protein
MDYILGGAAGRSYVAGYGPSPPQPAARCARDAAAAARGSGPHTLTGALVAGPDATDAFDDANATQSCVSVDANAGFAAALAGLVKSPVTLKQCRSEAEAQAAV